LINDHKSGISGPVLDSTLMGLFLSQSFQLLGDTIFVEVAAGESSSFVLTDDGWLVNILGALPY
jgi:hypothetical protein